MLLILAKKDNKSDSNDNVSNDINDINEVIVIDNAIAVNKNDDIMTGRTRLNGSDNDNDNDSYNYIDKSDNG